MAQNEKIDEINKSYKKWLISFQVHKDIYYTVWGADSTNGDDDKLLIDNKQRVILFKELKEVLHAIATLSVPVFDLDIIRRWALALLENDFLLEVDAFLNNLDDLFIQIKTIDYSDLQTVGPKDSSDLINFINLFGDYATQTKDDHLLQLWKNPSVHAFWEYMYNAYFWTIPADKLHVKQEELLAEYNAEECKNALFAMLQAFKDRLVIF